MTKFIVILTRLISTQLSAVGSDRSSDADYVDAAACAQRSQRGSSKSGSSVESKISEISVSLIDAKVPPRLARIFAREVAGHYKEIRNGLASSRLALLRRLAPDVAENDWSKSTPSFWEYPQTTNLDLNRSIVPSRRNLIR